MPSEEQRLAPSRPWMASSAFTTGAVGLLCRGFLMGLSKTEVNGLDAFLELLDKRKDVEGREKGLITVSNHVSVLDDPLMWGVLPLRYMFNPDNLRWGLGSYDLCFTNKGLATFFNLGQLLPTHRIMYSEHGGLFQPTITQAIRLLSSGPFVRESGPATETEKSLTSPNLSDPFSGAHLTYTTTGHDTFPSPSAYLNRRHSWIHIFPEGRIHQKEDQTMRYFKWGVSRLILESEPCPDVVPIWMEGPQDVMDEARTFPRPLPRPFKRISITFGDKIDGETAFGDLRRRWKQLRAKEEAANGSLEMGSLTDKLKYADEAVELRKECTTRVRQAVLDVRRTRGLPEEDPKAGLVETYALEGGNLPGKKEDGSIVRDE